MLGRRARLRQKRGDDEMKRLAMAVSAAAFGLFVLPSQAAPPGGATLLKPARVFDGVNLSPHEGWQVLVEAGTISAVGPNLAAPSGAKVIDLPGETLMPGLIEGHGHLFLHAYNETSWDDQVLHEPLALRTARAVAQ